MKAAFTLIPTESRRLIAKAVSTMPQVRRALEEAYVVINGGTTNGYVAQEILGQIDTPLHEFCVGTSTHRLLCVTDIDRGLSFPIVLHKGQRVDKQPRDALADFNLATIIIKGANAVDPKGNAGVVTGGFDGGTIASTFGTANAQGLKYVVPVGLEKLVSSVQEAVGWAGAKTIDYTMGADFGLFLIPKERAHVVTEIDALKILADVEAKHVASGGIGESAGAVVLIIQGQEEKVQKAISIIESIKGEPTLPGFKGVCEKCRYACIFRGKKSDQLPEWLKD
jgi:hypothetical protein